MRRSRRVVAPTTRLGASEEGDLTELARGHRPAPSREAPEVPEAEPAATAEPGPPLIPDRAREDTDEAWGDSADHDSRYLRDKPPHWS